MVLLGCSRSTQTIVNGVPYELLNVTDSLVTVKMVPECRRDLSLSKTGKAKVNEDKAVADQEGELHLKYHDASRWLRLPYCVTYRSSQGITARNKRVMITSLEKPCFDVRSLIVGSSRVAAANLLYCPTSKQERELLAQCPAVADPKAGEESESEDED